MCAVRDQSRPSATPALPWRDNEQYWSNINAATSHLPAPLVALHEPALRSNAADLVRRANGVPIRIASKSLRVRGVLETIVTLPGFRGVLAYTLPEALWLSSSLDDIVVGYPTTARAGIAALACDPIAAARVTLMVDHTDQLDLIDSVADPQHREIIRVCVDSDASFCIGRVAHVGVRRSPVHSIDALLQLARTIAERPGFILVGVMSYEAQIAGVGDVYPYNPLRTAVVRAVQGLSIHELRARRSLAVQGVRQCADLLFVNAGVPVLSNYLHLTLQ